MSENLEAFKVESTDEAIVVSPQGDSHSFRYDALHYEYNELHRLLDQPEVKHLVVDLSCVEFLGSLMLGVIIKLSRKVREGGGRVVLCGATEQMQRILESQNLASVWPTFPAREEALSSLQL